MAGKTTFLAMFAAAAFWLIALGAPGEAQAQCCAPPPPPPCCSPPPPCCQPPSPPPSTPPCCTPGHNINIPGINVFVAPSVMVNANVRASAFAGASAQGAVFVGGGGGGSYIGPGPVGAVQLNVEGLKRRVAYEAERSMFKKVVIQAFCFDDREVVHPASQVFADRDVGDDYEGELYRCMAGTHMQWTVSEWRERISFEGGRNQTCVKGEALWRVRGPAGAEGGKITYKLECRPQKPARDCNERSLLRRFGAGIKVLTIWWTEKYTAYREEVVAGGSSMTMSLDGGVGGVAY